MNVRTLLDNFDLIADAPGGVPKLRELILQLAVRGKLVPQDPNDEPAEQLEERLNVKRQRGAKKGKASKEASYQPITKESRPYDIPRSWMWTPLGNVAFIRTGKLDANASSLTGVYPFYTCAREPLRIDRYAYDGECVLLAGNGNFDVNYYDGKFEAYQRTYIIEGVDREMILGRYLYRFVQLYTDTLRSMSVGGVISYIKMGFLTDAPFPLPPLPEQKRIVAKVDELMKRCDELESRQRDRAAHHKTLVACCLNAVHARRSLGEGGTDPKKPNPNFIIHNSYFNLLFSSPESIAELRKTILQLALQGRLVPQDPRDESAAVLLRNITTAKKELFNAGVIKTSDIKVPVQKLKDRYKLPSKWCWTNIESISVVGTGSTPSRSNPAYFSHGSIPWVTSSATSAETIDHADNLITEIAKKETRLRLYPPGTLIVALYGQGKTRGQSSTLGIAATINQACAAIQIPFAADTIRSYVLLVFKKMYDEIREEAAGGAQPNLNVAKIKAMAVPLPPLAEQKRIVAKVNELMDICDALEAKLTQSRADADTLAAALVRAIGCGSQNGK